MALTDPSGFTLTVLGCSGSYAAPGEACSGYLLSSEDTHVWLDCGPGTLANLQTHVALDELTGIVTTHAHADHWSDLLTAHVAFQHYLDRRAVPTFGTAETRERFEAARGAPTGPAFDWHTITDGSMFELAGLRFTCAATDHPVETLAVRVADGRGRTLVYTADTGAEWSLASLGTGADVALCEATLADDEAGSFTHLTAREAGEAARAADASRLVLTHFAPGADREEQRRLAAAAFGADVEVASTHYRTAI